MRFIADLHIHSRFSMATSRNLNPEHLYHWAGIKGIQVVGTGDCVHPGWLNELKEKLEDAGNGLFRLKEAYVLPETRELFPVLPEVYFLLTGEISSIYRRDGRVRKNHNITFFPDFRSAEHLQARLERIGNIRSDGRPILGLDARELLAMVLETPSPSSHSSFLVPAHIWTPWFSVLGSRSGFDSIEECFGDLTGEIFALETGLSSDPPMNRLCSMLDDFALISNSDAHSPEKLGREANLFDTELSYGGIFTSIKEAARQKRNRSSGGRGREGAGSSGPGNLQGDGAKPGLIGTLEFFPEEGKYHYDGHRKCHVRWDPLETLRHKGVCPVCGKPVTVGVMSRVAQLADRNREDPAVHEESFRSLTPLPDILAEVMGKRSSSSVSVRREYMRLIGELGPEFEILTETPTDRIRKAGGERLEQALKNLRTGHVRVEEGFDGEFGRIRLLEEERGEGSSAYSSLRFDFATYRELESRG